MTPTPNANQASASGISAATLRYALLMQLLSTQNARVSHAPPLPNAIHHSVSPTSVAPEPNVRQATMPSRANARETNALPTLNVS